MTDRLRSRILRYGLAFLVSFAACAVTAATPLRTGAPFLLLIIAVLISTRYGGLGPGLIATFVSLVAGVGLVELPLGMLAGLHWEEVARLGLFLVSALLISGITAERDYARRVAQARAQQHAAIAELSQRALVSQDLKELFEQASRLLVQVLSVEYSYVCEQFPDASVFRVIAGAGWAEGIVGSAQLPGGTGSHAGYTLLSKAPVLVADLRAETRFVPAQLLLDHAVVSGMTVMIAGTQRPFGILGAHTRRHRIFGQEDIQFLQSMANVLAGAIQRRDASDALEQSSVLHRTFFGNLSEVVQVYKLIRDEQGAIVDWTWSDVNAPIVQMLNIPREQLLGQRASLVLGAEYVQRYLKPYARVLTTGEPWRYDTRFQDRQYAISVFRMDANTLGLSSRDVTERRRAEQALWESKELLERMFESTDVMIAYLDRDFDFIRVNRAYAQADQREPDFYVGKNHFALFPNEENRALFRRVVESGESYSVVAKPFEYADNPERGVTHWDWSLQPVKDPQGQVAGVVLSLVDVTERIRTEEDYHAATEHLRQVLTNLPVLMVALDRQGQYTLLEGSLTEKLDMRPDAVIGTSVWERLKDRPDILAHVANALAGEPSAADSEQNGRILHSTYSPLRDAEDQVVGMTTVAFDITERRQAEERVRELARDVLLLHEQDRQRVSLRLFNDTAQDLAALQMSMECAMDDPLGDRESLRENMRQWYVHLGETLEGLRSLAGDLRPPALDTMGLDKSLCYLCEGMARRTKVAIDYSGAPLEGVSAAHGTFLYRFVQEALSNAVGHVGVQTIRVSLAQEGAQILAAVVDNGVESNSEQVAPDLPLPNGLQAMQERLRILGGQLEYCSRSDKGTRVLARLPLT